VPTAPNLPPPPTPHPRLPNPVPRLRMNSWYAVPGESRSRAALTVGVSERSTARSAEAMGAPAEHRSGNQLSQPSGAQHSSRRRSQTMGKAAKCAATSCVPSWLRQSCATDPAHLFCYRNLLNHPCFGQNIKSPLVLDFSGIMPAQAHQRRMTSRQRTPGQPHGRGSRIRAFTVAPHMQVMLGGPFEHHCRNAQHSKQASEML